MTRQFRPEGDLFWFFRFQQSQRQLISLLIVWWRKLRSHRQNRTKEESQSMRRMISWEENRSKEERSCTREKGKEEGIRFSLSYTEMKRIEGRCARNTGLSLELKLEEVLSSLSYFSCLLLCIRREGNSLSLSLSHKIKRQPEEDCVKEERRLRRQFCTKAKTEQSEWKQHLSKSIIIWRHSLFLAQREERRITIEFCPRLILFVLFFIRRLDYKTRHKRVKERERGIFFLLFSRPPPTSLVVGVDRVLTSSFQTSSCLWFRSLCFLLLVLQLWFSPPLLRPSFLIWLTFVILFLQQ